MVIKYDFNYLVITFRETVTLRVIGYSYNKVHAKSFLKAGLKIGNKLRVVVKDNTIKKTLI